uniref:LRRCT domain-containing protein n=1 Tax=Panagrolaimus sp. JU765 TaxID=591449 RepID=A0AC34PUN9_9BILA
MTCVRLIQLHNRPDYTASIHSATQWEIQSSLHWLRQQLEATNGNRSWPVLINLHNLEKTTKTRIVTILDLWMSSLANKNATRKVAVFFAHLHSRHEINTECISGTSVPFIFVGSVPHNRMKLFKLGLLLLIFVIILTLVDARPKKNNKDDDDDDDPNTIKIDEEEDDEKPSKNSKKGRVKASNKKTDDDYDVDDQEDSTGAIRACSKGGICDCESKDELKCEKVMVDGKQLDTLHIEVVKEGFDAKKVNLKNNAIQRIQTDRIFPGQETTIESLDLSDNIIDQIDSHAFDVLTTLRTLKLSHNHIKKIGPNIFTEEFGEVLMHLYLDNNQIERITSKTFSKLTELTILVLDSNPIKELPKNAFPESLKNLEELSLDYCNIDKLDDEIFKNLVNLKSLSLIGNPIVSIPKAINAIPNLENLDLSATNLPEIHTEQIVDDHNLKLLRISNMKFLYDINDCAFCGLSKLETLTMENCSSLRNIDANAFGTEEQEKDETFTVPVLKELNLKNCNFTHLPPELLAWEKIEKLSISGNPFECNCEMSWLINNKTLHSFTDAPRCAGPDEFQGKTFSQVADTMCNPVKSKNGSKNVVLAFVLLMGVLGVITAFLFYTRRIRVTNVLYRPEVPEMGYSNLSAQQDHQDDERELQTDFHPKPDAAL